MRVGLLIAIVLLAAPANAAAQIDAPISDPLGAVDAWATAESLRRLLPDSDSAGHAIRHRPKHRARAPKPTKRQLAKLRFRRDPEVTDANNQAVIAEFADGVDPATVVADIERNRALAHEQLRAFEGRWSPNDLADVAAFALLAGYAAYHDKTSLSGAGCLAVRKAARRGLAARKQIRRTPQADKQTAAEMSEIRMIYSLAALNQARAEGDAIDADIARSDIRIWLRDVYGLDVSVIRLTRRGFAD